MICHQQQYYFDLSKCMPSQKEDGGVVFMFSLSEQIWISVPTFLVIAHEEMFKKRYSHWMQMPKAPAPTDSHAFLE